MSSLIKRGRRFLSVCTAVTTILWSVGAGLIAPQAVFAAVTVAGPFELIPSGGMHAPASSFDMPLVRFGLNQSASETLSSVAVSVVNNTGGAVSDNTLANHIASLSIFQDTDGNGVFDPATDFLAGTTGAYVTVTTSTNVITTGSNNTIGASGGLPTSYFITVRTASGWTGADAIKISLATGAGNAIATTGTSPSISTFTTTNQVDAQLGGGGGGGFGVTQVSYVSPTTVDVRFGDFLDLNSGNTTSTANYTFSGSGSGSVTSVNVLPDNQSVRVMANTATMIGNGTANITVSGNVKNQFGISNSATQPAPLFDSFQPLVISEIKAGSAVDQYDEFVELYNRSGNAYTTTSSLRLHIINANGTVDTNASLKWNAVSAGVGMVVPANGYVLIAPYTSPASSTADAVYMASSSPSSPSIVPNGALYISNSGASSTAVIDRVCWGTHAQSSDCAGSPAPALNNDGGSIVRKANNSSTAATMAPGGLDATNGNGFNSNNNAFDFVSRTVPESPLLNSNSAPQTMGGGSSQPPSIQFSSIFNATASSTLNLIARMTSSNGTLSSSKTQLIFCTTNTSCTPASSTPIYGTSIGSGWYKFSTTSTVWSNNNTLFKYYLQATDSATPPRTRVFTSDPTFDSTTFDTTSNGIQTQALQSSKALTINLSQGNLGGAAIAGTVHDTTGAGVGSATVWLDGTQFAVTTDVNGNFSLNNVGPTGGAQLRVAKTGFADQSMSIFVPSSGFVNLPTITMYSGNMGAGGDFSLPQITNTNPPPNSTGFPTQGPSGGAPSIVVNFSKSMNTATITNSDATGANSTIYLTTGGSATKIGGAVTAPSATQAVFTPTSALTAGQGYTLFVTPGVKDSSGNPIAGNGPGGQYVLMFGTTGQFFANTGQISNFGVGNAFPPYVRGSMPSQGSSNVPLNDKVFVTFSEAMQDTVSNRATVNLYKVTNQFTSSESQTLVGTTNSFDSSGKILTLTPTSALSASSHYRVVVLGGATSAKGIPLGNPSSASFSTTAFYKGDFDTGTANDTTNPTVGGAIPAASAAGVSTITTIILNFSKAMDPTTITNSTVVVKLGSNAVAGTLSYDSTSWTARFVPTYAFTAQSMYTLDITTGVKDLAGNALSQDYLSTFTTGAADATQPTVISAQSNDFAGTVGFSKQMLAVPAGDLNYANSALNPSNYGINVVNSSGVVQSTLVLPSTMTITYDAGSKSISMNGLPPITGFTAGTTLLNIVVSNVKDIGFNSLAAGGNAATSTAQSSSMSGGFGGGGMPFQDGSGNIVQGGSFGPLPNSIASFSNSGIGFIPNVHVVPYNSMAGVSTTYGIDMPISQQIPAGGFIDITFPDGTDVSQARPDPQSRRNSDIDGPGGTAAIGATEGTLPSGWTTGGATNDGVIVNTASRTVRVILGAVPTRSQSGDTHDFLGFDIAGIVNPTLVTRLGTAGNSVSVQTKKADGTVLESLSSGSFFTTQAGSFSLQGRVLSGATGLNGVNVYLMAPMTGPQTTSTATNRYGGNPGEFMFQNLVSGTYMLGVDKYFKSGGTAYDASFPVPININSTTCASNVCSQNVSVTNASTGATVTLNITGTFSAGGDAIDIFGGGPGAFSLATSTLTGTLTNNTSNSINLNANGTWMVGFGPSMSTQIFGGKGLSAPPAWIVPRPQQVIVSGCPGACVATPNTVSFTSSAANKTIKFTVQDGSGNKIGQANVFAYSPGGNAGNGTMASAGGTGSLGLSYGTYKISASFPGMPPGIERTIDIKSVSSVDTVFIDGSATGIALSAMAVTDLVLTVSKASYTITGNVTDGTNPVANASVSAFRSDGQGHANTFTDSSGNYTLYVGNGAWTVSAFLPQQYGRLPNKSVTISGASQSGIDFQPNTSSVNYATVTVSVGADTNSDGIFEAGEGLSNIQVTVDGTQTSGDHYFNTVTTDTNGSSTFKAPPGTYTLKAWSPTLGDFPPFSQQLIVNSAGTVTQQPADLLAPQTANVTVNIFDASGNATTTPKMAVEFEQIGGKTDNSTIFANVSSTLVTLPIYSVGASNIALGNVTSTNPSNFYLMKINIPGISSSGLNVYGDTGSTIMATSTVANGWWKVGVDGNKTIDVRLPAIDYVTGSVSDGTNAVPSATVHFQNTSTGETLEAKADTSGNYAAKLSSGTYIVEAEKNGYVQTGSTVTVSASGTIATAATTLTSTTFSIGGTITAGGAAVAGATVRGQELGGPVVTATTNASGVYSLLVTAGNWKVSAAADGYNQQSYANVVSVSSANATGVNIALTSANTTLAGSTSASVTPQTGGDLVDTTANVSIKAPQSAISTSANSYSLSDTETSNVVGGGAGAPIGGKAKSVTSYSTSDGSSVTSLNGNVGINVTNTTSALTSALGTLSISKIENVKMGSWDSSADNWEHLPTTDAYKDTNGNFVEPASNLSNVSTVAFTGQTVHFSVFNPIKASDGLAPAAPTGVTPTSATQTSVVFSWTAPTTNADGTALTDLLGYEIYRATSASGPFTQINTSDVTGTTSYTDTTVSSGSTYYYEVTAADTDGLESAMSAVSSGALVPTTASTGGNTSVAGGSGGGGGGAPATATPAQAAPSTVVPIAVAPSTASQPVVSAPAATTTATPAPATTGYPDEVTAILAHDAGTLIQTLRGVKRNIKIEKTTLAKFVAHLVTRKTPSAVKTELVNFVTYGTLSTAALKAQDRADILKEFKGAFKKVPSTNADWSDVLKIATGAAPVQKNVSFEKAAAKQFKKIFKRSPDVSQSGDASAIAYIAYGVRPAQRDISAEKAAIKVFRKTFKHAPRTAYDLDIMRSIAYSGVKK